MDGFTHAFTAREAGALREALKEVAARLTPPAPSSEYDEDAGVWTSTLNTSARQIHLQGLAIYAATAVASILVSRDDEYAMGMKWTADPGARGDAPFFGRGGTLSGDQYAAGTLGQLAGLAWQIIICRADRPTIEEEARRRSADAPELIEGIIESERAKVKALTPVLRRLMQAI